MPWLGDAVNEVLEPQPAWHHKITQTSPCPNFPKIHPHPYERNSVRVHPYAHPQHLKALRHIFYIQYGCGMQLMGDLQPQPLWHRNIIQARPYPIFPKNSPPPAQCIKGIRVYPYAICPSTSSQGAQALCIHPKWILNWGGFYRLKDSEWSRGIVLQLARY